MTLTWYGLSSFKIVSTGGGATIITDPFSKQTGLTSPRGSVDLVLISRDEELYSEMSGLTGDPLIIRNPGEIDFKGITIQGIPQESKEKDRIDTIYRIKIDDVVIAFLGAINCKELTDEQLEELGNIDILLLPIGGKEKVISWENAVNIVSQVEPSYVVPSFYKQNGLTIDLDSVDNFVKDIGGEAKTEDRLTLKSKDMSAENVQLVILNPQR